MSQNGESRHMDGSQLPAREAHSNPLVHRPERDQQITRLEELGSIVPACPSCAPFYRADEPLSVMAPRHKASVRCQSGRRPHCACDTCF